MRTISSCIREHFFIFMFLLTQNNVLNAAEHSDVIVSFTGKLVSAPPCKISGSPNVDFGDRSINDVKRDILMLIPLKFDCSNSIKNQLRFKVEGNSEGSGDYTQYIMTNKQHIYLRLVESNYQKGNLRIGQWYNFQKDSPPEIRAGTFHWDKYVNELEPGEFSANASIVIEYN